MCVWFQDEPADFVNSLMNVLKHIALGMCQASGVAFNIRVAVFEYKSYAKLLQKLVSPKGKKQFFLKRVVSNSSCTNLVCNKSA